MYAKASETAGGEDGPDATATGPSDSAGDTGGGSDDNDDDVVDADFEEVKN